MKYFSSRSPLETYNKGTPSCTSISWVIFKFNSHYPMTTLNLLSQDLNMIKINPESHVNVLYYLASMKHPFPHVAPQWWEPWNAILHVRQCRCSLWRVSPNLVQQVSQTFSYDPSHWKWQTHALMLEFRKRLVYTWSYFSPEVNLCNSLSLRGTDCNVGWMMSFIYWAQLTTISVTISRFLCIRITDSNVTKFGYNEHHLKYAVSFASFCSV